MVVIVGRPNVGKSSLFNLLMKERIAIEEPTEGVTRDRLISELDLKGRRVNLVDTGGIGIVDRQSLEQDVNEQIYFAMGGADLIVFVVDGQNDPMELDRTVAKRIRQCGVPVVLVANKIDNDQLEYEVSRFMALGFGEVVPISVIHQRGISALFKALTAKVPEVRESTDFESDLNIALCGRRNVGKSSLTNFLCGEKRVIVSDVEGTTRDAIDVNLEWGELKVTLVDTAGLRKKNQTEDSIEFFSVNRTFGALYRADLGVIMIDAERGVSQVDQKLGQWFVEHSKPCIIVVNKWDLAEGVAEKGDYRRYLEDRLPGLSYAPVVYASVKEGVGIQQLYDVLLELQREMALEFSTSRLNDVLQAAQTQKRPRRTKGHVPKLFYLTRLKQNPPTFLAFGKGVQHISKAYQRFLSQYFRKHLGIKHLPIRFVFKNRQSLYGES